jgi:hypothetical protein
MRLVFQANAGIFFSRERHVVKAVADGTFWPGAISCLGLIKPIYVVSAFGDAPKLHFNMSERPETSVNFPVSVVSLR